MLYGDGVLLGVAGYMRITIKATISIHHKFSIHYISCHMNNNVL